MSCDITNSVRAAIDNALGVAAGLGVNPYQVWVITITQPDSDIFGNSLSSKLRTDYRLTIGSLTDGFDPNLDGDNQDGYLNPHVEQVSSKDIFLSGGVLTDKMFKIGPLTYPYTTCQTGEVRGINWLISNPAVQEEQNLQLFFKVIGPAFPNGAYFRRVYSREDSNYCFWLFIENTAEIPSVNV